MSATTECPPLAVRITKSLLGYGAIAGPIYVVVAAGQILGREGYDPTRHSVSQLANGPHGWIQVANFIVCGAMVVAAAVGIGRALGPGRQPMAISVLIGGYGVALMVAGVFRADPARGFPPGTPQEAAPLSWQGTIHLAVAGLGFLSVVVASFVLAQFLRHRGEQGWALFSAITGSVFAASFVALSSGAGGGTPVLVFTAAVVLLWLWLSAVSVKLYREAGQRSASA
ncbi:DUF998 domain-containing protein [Mycolicibacterium sp. 3033]|nr:DUF998 domain-containing protein [Mycolicibacterium aurantiacum]